MRHVNFATLVASMLAWLLSVTLCSIPNAAESASKVRNHVAEYLSNAELQCECGVEGSKQGENIELALRDMLNLDQARLRRVRYPDYGGTPNRWSITELLGHYFLAYPPINIDQERFYKDVSKPQARKAIKMQLDLLTRNQKLENTTETKEKN